MNTGYNFYVFSLYLAVVLTLIVAFFAWKRRKVAGAYPLVIMMLCILIWTLFQALVFIDNPIDVKIILANMRYFGIETVPIAFYALAFSYSNKGRSLSLKKWLLYLIFPAISIILLWTNHLHHLFYLKVSIENQLLVLKDGPLFWANMAYLYIFVFLGVYIFIKVFIESSSAYRNQAIILAMAALFPTLANLIFNFNILPIGEIDCTPFSFLITGLLYFYVLFEYKLFLVVPVAREKLVEDMEDIIIVVDNDNRVLDINRSARETILKISDKNCYGKKVSDVLEDWRELADYIMSPPNENHKLEHSSRNRTEYYDLKITRIYNDKREESGKLIVLRNITNLEEALLETKRAKEEAEYASKAKGHFLANVSHEVRTPLNAIIGIAEILNTMMLSREKQKEYVKMIENSAESLLTMINDILDYSKIEAGKMELEKSEFSIIELVNEIVKTYSVLAENKLLTLECSIDENLGKTLLGDSVRVRQILINLLSNSLKFTREGHIRVSVLQEKVQGNKVLVAMTVSDTGIGISKDKLDSIFESFKQADNSTTRKYGGSGLGLSIVKNLVNIMGGDITVESESGEGSSFCCHLPFEFEEKSQENSVEKLEDIDINILPGLRVLVADDNKINRHIIGTYLKRLCCEISFAENGNEVVSMFEEDEYDIIFMDVQMPEMDGLEATRKIRSKEKETGKHIPIIALTAGVMKEDVEECMNAGMDAHLSKPIRIEKLYNAIKAFL